MDDLIKREDVIKAVGGTRCVDDIDEEIYAIPSADTEIEIIKAEAYAKGIDSERKRISDWCRPSGEWIESRYVDEVWVSPRADFYKCSICGKIINSFQMHSYNYCPVCGARMKGADDEESV